MNMCGMDRIKAITNDAQIVFDALHDSKRVELHDSELKVKKKQFNTTSDDADRRTIYVEGFPMNADHDTLRARFSAVGEVTLVPRTSRTVA